ncbi:MAG: tRNA preQ1(34) S-adenosylmethionine ribosyltransferase-isomerase QueA [Planctomycetota bacterium]|nr:tRNA preQ1(34) S-adenosylmethionine ribosyltransferase-isomerase QueA [Planctomycetota bacterium]
MRTEDLDFPLPNSLIAAHPPKHRRDARLLCVSMDSQSCHHGKFTDFLTQLQAGDLLVLNDTQVVPARFLAKKETGGHVEGLWLEEAEDGLAICMLSGGRLREGIEIFFEGAPSVKMILHEKMGKGQWKMRLEGSPSWLEALSLVGSTPLPPYIRTRRRESGEVEENEEDAQRYQTVWARFPGAVAAPTASLHLDEDFLQRAKEKGVGVAFVTLHVGSGTFLPVETEDLSAHPMHREKWKMSAETVKAIQETKISDRRVIAAGTTVCRVLETPGVLEGGETSGETDLLIMPGFSFQVVDALLTNFHTPRSTLLALVSAFAEHLGATDGLSRVKEIYAEAVREKYQFFSYGDASFWSSSSSLTC